MPDIMDAETTIMLAGNPNVGKSTIFNALTGLRQHTGNWPGKTVATAAGWFQYQGKRLRLVDLPGTYSLCANSPEEEITRDALSFGGADRVLLVADAVGLERNLFLVLQTLSITHRAILCVNLMDEAEKRGVSVKLSRLSELLGIPVIGTSAHRKKTLLPLMTALTSPMDDTVDAGSVALLPEKLTDALQPLAQWLESHFPVSRRRAMWMAVTLLGDEAMHARMFRWCGEDLSADSEAKQRIELCRQRLSELGIGTVSELGEMIDRYRLRLSREIAEETVDLTSQKRAQREWTLDRILTSRAAGYPVMLLLLTLIFALTVRGADAPSRWLSQGLFRLGDRLSEMLLWLGCPKLLHDALILGAYRMLAWVVSVMLPPMLIFFPLFSLLEDVGYLPRIAFELDHCFQRCGSCGKQALTMGMGLGCNAVGVTSCRIIASPRERLLAILTNSFIPCNGRFPMMILLIGLLVSPGRPGAAFLLCGCVLFAVAVTLGMTKLLSATALKGKASMFVLELPPYRRPLWGQILVRSLLDRTVFVLGRAVAVAAPAGLLLWAMGTLQAGDSTLLSRFSAFLDPLGRLMGMDGVILLAFILGSPANETVLPIAVMIYLSASSLSAGLPSEQIREILLQNGWSWMTAASTILFTMLHWPCTTTLLTVRKETNSVGWTVLAAILPAVCGIIGCILLHGAAILLTQ